MAVPARSSELRGLNEVCRARDARRTDRSRSDLVEPLAPIESCLR